VTEANDESRKQPEPENEQTPADPPPLTEDEQEELLRRMLELLDSTPSTEEGRAELIQQVSRMVAFRYSGPVPHPALL
jgi:hypothetical protein